MNLVEQGPGQASPPSPGPAFPWGVALGLFGLALTGIALLAYAIFSLTQVSGARQATPTPTAFVPAVSVVIPTTTPQPSVTLTRPPTHTPTRPTVTETPAATATEPEPSLTINVGANVRTGPGINYPVIGGLEAGATADVVGRDSSARWFVISFAGGAKGRGWVSGLVSTYTGDASSLPVITAPPPPPPTSTPRPADTGPPPIGARGISGQLTMCNPKTTYAAGVERICFREWIKNNTAEAITYGLIGVHAANLSGGPGQFQTSWDGAGAPGGVLAIDPGCIGPTDRCGGDWEDGMIISTPGTYRLTLQICYSDFGACLAGGQWEVLTSGIIITVVN